MAENIPSPPRQAAVYIRVSTQGRQEELSPAAQLRLIKEFAAHNHIEIIPEYVFQEAISGRRAEKRPKFQEMIGWAKKGAFDTILVWKFSRFARNQEESIVYKNMLRKDKVEVISISEPIIDGPFGSLIERIIEWMDEYYSIRLSGDVFRGMTENALRGHYQCRPPLGYRIPYPGATPEIIPEEADTVRLIFDLYVNQRKSIFEITRYLNSLGQKTSRKNPFEKRSIEYILQNPAYSGWIRWNRTENATNEIKDKEEWIVRKGQHPAIIDKELFDKAQERYESEYHPKGSRPAEQNRHWLSGVVKCSACGRTLSCSTTRVGKTKKLNYHFQCYGYLKGKCNVSHSISALKLEPVVLAALQEALDSGIDHRYVTNLTAAPSDHEKRLAELKIALERCETRLKRAKDAYMAEIDTLEEYQQNKKKILADQTDLQQKYEAELMIQDEYPESDLPARIQNALDIIQSDSFTMQQKNAAMKSVVSHIDYIKAENQIIVHYYEV